MADRIRALDWSTTPLGPASAWPQSLRTLVAQCLGSHSPMYVWWGPQLINLYNDAYIPLAGSLKHPQFLGRPAREMWPEIWDSTLVPFIEEVRATGSGIFRENLRMALERAGRAEAGYFTFSFGPAFDERGEIAGIVCTCYETTTQLAREAHFHELVDNSPAILWTTDADGRCTYLSRQWFEITGRTPEQDLGLGWLENVHPADRARSAELFLKANAARTPFRFDYRLRQRDGSYRWAMDSGFPRLDAAGQFIGFIGNVIDVHDRNVLEARFRNVAESVGLGLWYCDLPFDELIWDRTVKEHFFLEPDARVTIGTFFQRIHPEDRERTRRAIEHSIANQAPYDIFYRTTDPADSRREKHIRAIGWTDYGEAGTPIRFDGVTLDVTDEKRAEDDLRSAIRARDEFLSIASHELKTPLTSLKLQTQIVTRAAQRGLPATDLATKTERLIAQTDRQVDRLARLVEDMLDVSRLATGRLSLVREKLDLAQLVAESCEQFQAQFEAAGVQLELRAEGPVFAVVDRARIEQVVSNLLSNALKYGNGRPVRVAVGDGEGRAHIAVRDEGLGIAAENLARVFDRFERAVPASAISGLGLGLFISKQIVELHGGRIGVSSELGRGSTFLVELPATN